MNNAGNNIRKSLLKRQEALDKFKARKETFLLVKKQITKDIEEARIIWIQTIEQLPGQGFYNEKATGSTKPVKGNSRQATGIRKSIKISTYKPINHHEQQQ
ncbi:MAG: hypothetical protein NTZ69_07830 [Bacteroidia bacterium]|nr:hypothetical protein [Bacteroidia bacterium]